MARRFRRRRGTQIWMPTYGNAHDVDSLDAVIGSGGTLNVLPAGDISVDAFPVTFDENQSSWFAQYVANQPQSLHDIVAGQEWRLLRVVGKIHAVFSGVAGGQDPTFYPPPAAEFAAGLIVLRGDEENNVQADLDEVNPLAMESANDPWIWRRKWILTQAQYNLNTFTTPPAYGTAGTVANMYFKAAQQWPTSTSGHHAVADGPHVDQKTRRLISKEERLYWVLAARTWDPTDQINNTGGITPGSIYYSIDNRFVGRLSSKMGNRNNASR